MRSPVWLLRFYSLGLWGEGNSSNPEMEMHGNGNAMHFRLEAENSIEWVRKPFLASSAILAQSPEYLFETSKARIY